MYVGHMKTTEQSYTKLFSLPSSQAGNANNTSFALICSFFWRFHYPCYIMFQDIRGNGSAFSLPLWQYAVGFERTCVAVSQNLWKRVFDKWY